MMGAREVGKMKQKDKKSGEDGINKMKSSIFWSNDDKENGRNYWTQVLVQVGPLQFGG
jgi:hypothetical protein